MGKTLRIYIIGFVASLLLTFASYVLVLMHTQSSLPLISTDFLIATILIIALIQLVVQLIFFLHLGKEPAQRWNVIFFIGTFGSILVVIVASIWIMNHLNYNMSPSQVLQYIQQESSF